MKMFSTDGLSARRWTIDSCNIFATKIHQVIKCGALFGILVSFILFSSCEDKSKREDSTAQKTSNSTAADSLDKPRVNIQVNKRYDDKGNLIGFDSTYSSYYSNLKGDTSRMDSLMHRFDRYFDSHRSSFYDSRFNSLFFNDSMRYPDFFHSDYFLKRYELNDPYLRSMMERMDSMKNRFFYEESQKEKKSKTLK